MKDASNISHAFNALFPYFDNEINYSDLDRRFDDFLNFGRQLVLELNQKFGLNPFMMTPGNYRKCHSLQIFLDGNLSSVEYSRNAFFYDLEKQHYEVQIDLSAKSPFCTYCVTQPIKVADQSSNHVLASTMDIDNPKIFPLVQSWVDWLCEIHGVTYLPFRDLMEVVPGYYNRLTDDDATLYSLMFTDE